MKKLKIIIFNILSFIFFYLFNQNSPRNEKFFLPVFSTKNEKFGQTASLEVQKCGQKASLDAQKFGQKVNLEMQKTWSNKRIWKYKSLVQERL